GRCRWGRGRWAGARVPGRLHRGQRRRGARVSLGSCWVPFLARQAWLPGIDPSRGFRSPSLRASLGDLLPRPAVELPGAAEDRLAVLATVEDDAVARGVVGHRLPGAHARPLPIDARPALAAQSPRLIGQRLAVPAAEAERAALLPERDDGTGD